MYTGWFHPATWIALIVVFGGMMIVAMGSMLYDTMSYKRRPEFRPLQSISVVESKVHHGVEKDIPYVSCIGTLRNNTDTIWGDVHFQVRFFDSAGQLVDTLSDSEYSLIVQPHAEAAMNRSQPNQTRQPTSGRVAVLSGPAGLGSLLA